MSLLLRHAYSAVLATRLTTVNLDYGDDTIQGHGISSNQNNVNFILVESKETHRTKFHQENRYCECNSGAEFHSFMLYLCDVIMNFIIAGNQLYISKNCTNSI